MSDEANREKTACARGYGRLWRKFRLVFLASHPLCAYCAKLGVIQPATVVDHIVPHGGDADLFWDESNLQPLCHQCHASQKQREERGTPRAQIGLDGWPVH